MEALARFDRLVDLVAVLLPLLEADLLDRSSFALALSAVPLMFAATFAGRRFNETIGERGYKRLFWAVMGGYAARLFILL